MLYYRFRPINELSFKELRYNEMFFSSSAEKNDPYDGKVFLSYDFSVDKTKRLIESALSSYPDKNLKTRVVEILSSYISNSSLTTYEELTTHNYFHVLSKNIPEVGFDAVYIDKIIKNFIKLYTPSEQYTVSFAKHPNNMLLWSHYASMHRGYVLIFRDIDGFIYQDRNRTLSSINYMTSRGLAPSMAIGVDNSFKFQDIIYCDEINKISADRFMPVHVYGREISDEEKRIKFNAENYRMYSEKHSCWSYEEESRIILNSPAPWLFGEHIEYTKEERLLHYQPTQLVGIIFGALMDEKDKLRIRQVVKMNIDRVAIDCRGLAIFDFIFFQAALSSEKRDIDIIPLDIIGLSFSADKTDPKFTTRYSEWKEGWALAFNETGGASRKQFA